MIARPTLKSRRISRFAMVAESRAGLPAWRRRTFAQPLDRSLCAAAASAALAGRARVVRPTALAGSSDTLRSEPFGISLGLRNHQHACQRDDSEQNFDHESLLPRCARPRLGCAERSALRRRG